jgi:hypothetical protein
MLIHISRVGRDFFLAQIPQHGTQLVVLIGKPEQIERGIAGHRHSFCSGIGKTVTMPHGRGDVADRRKPKMRLCFENKPVRAGDGRSPSRLSSDDDDLGDLRSLSTMAAVRSRPNLPYIECGMLQEQSLPFARSCRSVCDADAKPPAPQRRTPGM